jgi:DNA-binding protein
MSDKSGIVFIGSKPPMDYVLAIITGLSANNAKELTLKARGRSITTAVDAAEITRRRFIKDLTINKVAGLEKHKKLQREKEIKKETKKAGSASCKTREKKGSSFSRQS